MQLRRALQKYLLITVLSSASGTMAYAQCPPFQDVERAKLIDYVLKKYRAPAGAGLEIAAVSFVDSTCYRKVQFRAQDPRSNFRVDLIATPDLRFLTRELLDSTVDPVVEERLKSEALLVGLTRGGVAVVGNQDAPVTIAVFSDFQCPYCAGFAAMTRDVVTAEAGKVRLFFHQFPLPMHAWARPAAEATACAQLQGNEFFWPFHDYLFAHQKEITPDTLQQKLAEFANGLPAFDQGKFAMCLVERKTAKQVDSDVAFAQQHGITGTPTVFINGQKTQVASPDQLRTWIRQLSESSVDVSPARVAGRAK